MLHGFLFFNKPENCFFQSLILLLELIRDISLFMRFIFRLLAAIILFTFTAACKDSKETISIDGCSIRVVAIDNNDGAAEIRNILERNRAKVDSIKRPVIGEAAHALNKSIPESPLMNFAADALLEMARKESGEHIDIAVTNKGGLRSNISKGTITFGDIFNVFPFENTLALLTLNGEQLERLCEEIASVGGEAISGMRLKITPDGKLTDATVNGKPIDKNALYRIATSDYLSQGNDKLTTLAQGTQREIKNNTTIRDLMIRYIKGLDAEGKKLQAQCDGRITITE